MKELELFEYNEECEADDKAELPNFPEFVVEYFAKIYGLQSLLHKVLLVLCYFVYSLH